MGRSPAPGPGDPRGRSHQGPSTTHPIAPTELPKGWSAADVGMRDPEAGPHCDIHPSSGGYQPPVTSEDGYGLRLTPERLRIMIAIGQPSTDSFRAHKCNLWVFGPPSRPLIPGIARRSGSLGFCGGQMGGHTTRAGANGDPEGPRCIE